MVAAVGAPDVVVRDFPSTELLEGPPLSCGRIWPVIVQGRLSDAAHTTAVDGLLANKRDVELVDVYNQPFVWVLFGSRKCTVAVYFGPNRLQVIVPVVLPHCLSTLPELAAPLRPSRIPLECGGDGFNQSEGGRELPPIARLTRTGRILVDSFEDSGWYSDIDFSIRSRSSGPVPILCATVVSRFIARLNDSDH